MKRILLTSTSLVMFAGLAAAETSMTWSGTGAAGIARQGETVVGTRSTLKTYTAAVTALEAQATALTEASVMQALLVREINAFGSTRDISADATPAQMRAEITASLLDNAVANATADAAAAVKLQHLVNQEFGTVAVATGDWDTYSEVNLTVVGSVAMDNGMTLSAAVSVDAGTGYDFADDDTFDAAKGGATLDSVSLAMGSMGTLTLDENNIAQLVDGDDDESADLKYTNTIGAATVTIVADMDKDADNVAAAATYVAAGANATATTFSADDTFTYTAATTEDVAWSAKVSMPLAGGTAFVAMDEEGGNTFGASATLSGIVISFDSKLEAYEEALSIDRSNTIGLSYALGATTLGASWNSVEDGDQWGISAAYAADGLSISASTDEGSDWSVSGSYALGAGAKVVAGTNYTEDAYLGLSFAF